MTEDRGQRTENREQRKCIPPSFPLFPFVFFENRPRGLRKTNRGDAQRVEFILLTALGAEDRKGIKTNNFFLSSDFCILTFDKLNEGVKI